MKSNTYKRINQDIDIMLASARIKLDCNNDEIGKRIGLSGDRIKHIKSEKKFPEMRFQQIYLLAEMAGYELVLRPKGGQYL